VDAPERFRARQRGRRSWECPDLFPLEVDGKRHKTKWVILVSLNPGGIAGGSGMRYFVGDLDGTTFRADNIAGDYTPPAGTLSERSSRTGLETSWVRPSMSARDRRRPALAGAKRAGLKVRNDAPSARRSSRSSSHRVGACAKGRTRSGSEPRNAAKSGRLDP
jgi:hypothetical protein